MHRTRAQRQLLWFVGGLVLLFAATFGLMLQFPVVVFVPTPAWSSALWPTAPIVLFVLAVFSTVKSYQLFQVSRADTAMQKGNAPPGKPPVWKAAFAQVLLFILLFAALSGIPYRLVPMAHAFMISEEIEVSLTVQSLDLGERRRADNVYFEGTPFLWGSAAFPPQIMDKLEPAMTVFVVGVGSWAGVFPSSIRFPD